MGIIGNKEHNHPSNPQRKQALERKEKISKQLREMSRMKPYRVLADVRSNITDEVFVKMGSNKALEQLISRFHFVFVLLDRVRSALFRTNNSLEAAHLQFALSATKIYT